MKIYSVLLLSLVLTACASTGSQSKKQAKPAAPVGPNVYELLNRIDQMQVEIQQLRGNIEQQTHSIDELKRHQKLVLADFEQRLQYLETPVLENNAALSELEPENTVATTEEVVPAEGNADTATPKISGTEKQIYQQGYKKLTDGHYNQAIAIFNQVVTDYPNGQYADNAQYWLGEAYKVKRDTPRAKQAFEKVLVNFPDSPKVPDAMLKLAYIAIEQGNTALARANLLDIIADYGSSTAARLAETKLMQLDGAIKQ